MGARRLAVASVFVSVVHELHQVAARGNSVGFAYAGVRDGESAQSRGDLAVDDRFRCLENNPFRFREVVWRPGDALKEARGFEFGGDRRVAG